MYRSTKFENESNKIIPIKLFLQHNGNNYD